MKMDTLPLECAPTGRPSALSGGQTIWEAGHYYLAKGPTIWSQAGWKVLSGFARPDDGRMLFIDDVHGLHEVNEIERELDRVPFDPFPLPTHLMVESKVLDCAEEILERLHKLPKRQRARKTGNSWQCSGFPLKSKEGLPLCLLYDLGLTLHKQRLGFSRAVNIVPEFYEIEQRRLLRLVRKAMPDFELHVVLHNSNGDWRHLADA